MATVAVVGTGRMGSAMARRLAGAGFSLILWNRTKQAAERLAAELGSEDASSPAHAAAESSLVLASLADDEAVAAVHTGPDGTLEGLGPGGLLIETSTVSPDTIVSLAVATESGGARLLDAPVSGSSALVAKGELTIMVGGDPEAVELAGPVFAALASKIFPMGPNGTGATMKLAVNNLVHAINLALSESLVLAEAAGIERRLAYDVFESGAGGSPFVRYKREAFLEPEEAAVAFTLDLVRKDHELILELAERLGVLMDQGEVTAAATEKAIAAGLGDADMSALAFFLRQRPQGRATDGAGVAADPNREETRT